MALLWCTYYRTRKSICLTTDQEVWLIQFLNEASVFGVYFAKVMARFRLIKDEYIKSLIDFISVYIRETMRIRVVLTCTIVVLVWIVALNTNKNDLINIFLIFIILTVCARHLQQLQVKEK